MKKLVKIFLIILMWYPLRWIVRLLPLKTLYRLGQTGGKILHLISGGKRMVMAEEYRRVLPDESPTQISAIVKRAFQNYSTCELEVLLYPSLNTELMNQIVTIEGTEFLDSALEKGKGVLLFQAHFGAFQMTMPAIGFSGYKMNQISAAASIWKDQSDSGIQKKTFDIKARYERALPVTHISVESSMRPVFRALEQNEIVGVTVDGGGGNKAVKVQFLGREANFLQGGADLALRTGAVIIPAFIISEPNLKHRLTLHRPLIPDSRFSQEANIQTIIQNFARLLEGYVRQHPDHYGYTLCLRQTLAKLDTFPFFTDYEVK
jgi:phosphatidylinositol dimannoside acyltransferase